MMLRRCALLSAFYTCVGSALVAAHASPRHDPAYFDGIWNGGMTTRAMRNGDSAEGADARGAPPSCRAGLCAGAGTRYPTGPGIVFESEYNVPELPVAFGPDTMLTDYLCEICFANCCTINTRRCCVVRQV